jgi:hypothetical protein
MSENEHTSKPPGSTGPGTKWSAFPWFIVVLFVIGLLSRAAPLLNQEGRLLSQFPTEDGYFMLQIARNIAIGNGMSTADGKLPTNGTQPLTTFIWAGCFKLADGDKTVGVAYVHVLQMIFGLLAAFVLYRLGRMLLRDYPAGTTIAAFAAAVWYAGPLTAKNTQNCLETGTYTLVILLSVWALVVALRDWNRPWAWSRCVGLGIILGLAFWTRNDAAFLILAACVVRVVLGLRAGLPSRGLAETVVMGAVSVVVASPWLAYNLMKFGHLMPISGVSESMHAHFGQNLAITPVALAEYILTVFPIPNSMEHDTWVVAASVVCVLTAIGLIVAIGRRSDRQMRAFLWIVGIYALGLIGFYGLYFGVGHFVNRYMFPLSPFLALLWAGIVVWAFRRMPRAGIAAALVVLVVLLAGLNVRVYRKGKHHLHFDVIEWVQANVPDDVWVGAIQTGTLGYFHDRTINLDGKVNYEALEARKKDEIPQYVLDKGIVYLADWRKTIITLHAEREIFRDHFDLILPGEVRNVGVLKRRGLSSSPSTLPP